MKIIILCLVAISSVFSAKCPSREAIGPCICDPKSKAIICKDKSQSNLASADDHLFSWFRISTLKGQGSLTLTNVGRDIDRFVGINIDMIDSNAFNQTSDQLKVFNCYECSLVNQPPNYDLQKIFNQMSQLTDLQIGLNLTNKTLNEILPNESTVNGIKLDVINIKTDELTIKTGALNKLENLASISFNGAKIKNIEREAFAVNYTSNFTKLGLFFINFRNCKLEDGAFQSGSFDGIQKSFGVEISFEGMNISHLDEAAFNQYLNVTNYSIALFGDSTIDCDDCKNYWLVKQGKEKQVKFAHCKSNLQKTLFDDDIQTKLRQKCK